MLQQLDFDKDIFMALSTKIVVVIVILIVTIAGVLPNVGHDYEYFIPRLGDTYLHYQLNGLSVQWYTPSFAGGLPAYPNPQHIQFSLPQLFTFITTPWISSLISLAIFALIGFISTYYFLRHILLMHWRVGMLGALFYTGNGFYFQHMAVGHMGFQVFHLLSLLLVIFFEPSLSRKKAIIFIGLTGALMIYSAGFIPIAIFVLSFGVTLPLLYLIKPSIFDWRTLGLKLVGGLGVGVLLSASKLSAIYSQMRYFPREVSDTYIVDLGQSFLGLLLQLLGVMNILPIASLAGVSAREVSDYLRHITGAYYGLWELDISLSPVLVVILMVGVVEYYFINSRRGKLKLLKNQKIAMGLLGVSVWVTIEFIFAKGILFPFLSRMPVLGSLHVNVRYGAAFIFPLVLIGCVIFNNWVKKWGQKKIIWVSDLLSLISIIFLLSYFFVVDEQSRSFIISPHDDFYHEVRKGESFPVTSIQNIADDEGAIRGLSGLVTEEIIFGYDLENFNHNLVEGSVEKIENDSFNMTNPASLVFPEVNQLMLFERISVDDEKNFRTFINHYQPDWQLPFYQKALNIISLLTGAGLLGGFAYVGLRHLRNRKK